MNLFLDDDPARAAVTYNRMSEEERSSTIWCRTVEEAINTLRDFKDMLKKVDLDHDLEGLTFVHPGREDCGMEIVRFLEGLSRNSPDEFKAYKAMHFIVHTWNTKAGSKMTERLQKIGLKAEYKPFGL